MDRTRSNPDVSHQKTHGEDGMRWGKLRTRVRGWQGSAQWPRSTQPGSMGASWVSATVSLGARGCELPATTSYHTADSTHMRQAGDEGQSGMKKTKEKPMLQFY